MGRLKCSTTLTCGRQGSRLDIRTHPSHSQTVGSGWIGIDHIGIPSNGSNTRRFHSLPTQLGLLKGESFASRCVWTLVTLQLIITSSSSTVLTRMILSFVWFSRKGNIFVKGKDKIPFLSLAEGFYPSRGSTCAQGEAIRKYEKCLFLTYCSVIHLLWLLIYLI